MPVTKLTCPECHAVLRPAKPIPEGKQIKCPKCGASITVGAENGAITEKKPAVQGSAARTTKAPAKPAAQPAKPPAPAKIDDEDDDGGGATYGLLLDPEAEKAKQAPKKKRRDPEDEDYDEDEDEEDEDEEEEKPDVAAQYIINEKTRDPRGPAQELIVTPSNWLMLVGILGAFGYFVCVVLALWPFIFPPDDDEKGPQSIEKKAQQTLEAGPGIGFVAQAGALYPTDNTTSGGAETAKDNAPLFDPEKDVGDPSKTTVLFFDMGDLGYTEIWLLATVIILFCLGIVYNAFIVYGAVEIQRLENRTWGLVGSVLAIIPGISGMGCFIVISLITLFLVRMFLEMVEMFDTSGMIAFVFYYSLVVMLLFIFGGTITGIRTLIALNKPEVIAGYEFKTD